jgi:hypothetical protein
MTECVAVGSESDEVLTNLNATCFGLLITEKLLSTVLGSDLLCATNSRKSWTTIRIRNVTTKATLKHASEVYAFKKPYAGRLAVARLRLYDLYWVLQHKRNTDFKKTNISIITEDFQRQWLQHTQNENEHRNTSHWGDKILLKEGGVKNYFSLHVIKPHGYGGSKFVQQTLLFRGLAHHSFAYSRKNICGNHLALQCRLTTFLYHSRSLLRSSAMDARCRNRSAVSLTGYRYVVWYGTYLDSTVHNLQN